MSLSTLEVYRKSVDKRYALKDIYGICKNNVSENLNGTITVGEQMFYVERLNNTVIVRTETKEIYRSRYTTSEKALLNILDIIEEHMLYLDKLFEKEIKNFFGENNVYGTKRGYNIKRNIDYNNTIAVTSKTVDMGNTYLLVTGENKGVFVNPKDVRAIHEVETGKNLYALKINRDNFKVYELENNINVNIKTERSFNYFFEKAQKHDLKKNIIYADGHI